MAQTALIEAAARGDEDAFAALASQRIDRMYATATLILTDRSRAEDAVQDALLRAWRDLPKLRDHARLDAWLRRLLVNACLDQRRRNKRHAANVRLLPEHDPTVGDAAGAFAEHDALDAAIRSLSIDHRAVIVHHYYLDLSLPEIADALGIPVGTAKSRLHHARLALRESLESSGPGRGSEGYVA